MGSWNSTDGLTQLPICSGDRVVVYLLEHDYRRGALSDGICYSTDICEPIFLPFRAEYNDYGGIENAEKTFNTELILKWANSALQMGRKREKMRKEEEAKPEAERKKIWWGMCDDGLYLDEEEIEENEKHIKAIEAAGKKVEDYERRLRHEHVDKFDCIEDFFTAVERGRVTFGSHKRNRGRPEMTYMMVREDVHDAVTDMVVKNVNQYRQSSEWIKGPEKMDFREQLETDATYLLEWLHQEGEKMAKFKAALIEWKKGGEKGERPQPERESFSGRWGGDASTLKSCEGGKYPRNSMSVYLAGTNGYSMGEFYHYLRGQFDAGAIAKDGKEWDSLHKGMMEFALLSYAMTHMRKTWTPQAGAGSQDTEFELYSGLADIMKDVANAKIKEYAEY